MKVELNPWNVWKQAYDTLEQNYGEGIQKYMHEESFAAWMDSCQQWYLYCRDMQNQFMDQMLQQWRMPSKEEVAQVSSLVIQVEEKIEALEDQVNFDIMEQLKSIQETLKLILEKERG